MVAGDGTSVETGVVDVASAIVPMLTRTAATDVNIVVPGHIMRLSGERRRCTYDRVNLQTSRGISTSFDPFEAAADMRECATLTGCRSPRLIGYPCHYLLWLHTSPFDACRHRWYKHQNVSIEAVVFETMFDARFTIRGNSNGRSSAAELIRRHGRDLLRLQESRRLQRLYQSTSQRDPF